MSQEGQGSKGGVRGEAADELNIFWSNKQTDKCAESDVNKQTNMQTRSSEMNKHRG